MRAGVRIAGFRKQEFAAIFEFNREFGDGWISRLRIPLQAVRNNATQLWRYIGSLFAERFRIVAQFGRERCGLGLRLKGSFAAEYLVQHGTEGEHIAARVELAFPQPAPATCRARCDDSTGRRKHGRGFVVHRARSRNFARLKSSILIRPLSSTVVSKA